MTSIFFLLLLVLCYTYFGYGGLLYLINQLALLTGKKCYKPTEAYTPEVTLVVTAYNEEAVIREKITNTLALQYPPEKIRYLFITDGSTDATNSILAEYPAIQLQQHPLRLGKMAAIQRAMEQVHSEIVVLTDANTILGEDAILWLCRHFSDPQTGGVAGEKRVILQPKDDATSLEGIYWRWESWLKKQEADFHTVVGAAGELFAFRVSLYEALPADTITDDFMISMRMAARGYRIRYEPAATAMETGSLSIAEEWKRKTRIASGGIQSFFRLKQVWWPLPYPKLWLSYMSHRFLRWFIAPYLLPVLLWVNGYWLFTPDRSCILLVGFFGQCLFYILALLGYFLRKKKLTRKWVFAPFYFCLMNGALVKGMFQYLLNRHTVLWEKAKRK